MRSLIKNKRGGIEDLFVFMIFIIVFVMVSGIMIYIAIVSTDALHENLDDIELNNNQTNMSQLIDDSMGDVNSSYQALYWIAMMLIVGMVISIFIGSYMVTTKPIFFLGYIFILIIAITVSIGISMGYSQFLEKIQIDSTLANVFDGFVGANEVLSWLPLWICLIGITGGIIMFTRMGTGDGFSGGYQ